jgi:hypothetical protein
MMPREHRYAARAVTLAGFRYAAAERLVGTSEGRGECRQQITR